MRGKKARALRRAIGYKAGTPRTYHKVIAAYEFKMPLNKKATIESGEARYEVIKVPKITWFHQDELRAQYQAAKHIYKRKM